VGGLFACGLLALPAAGQAVADAPLAQAPRGLAAAAATAAPLGNRLPPLDAVLDPGVTPVSYAQPQDEVGPAPDAAPDDMTELLGRLEATERELAKLQSDSKSAADKLVAMLGKAKSGASEFPLIRLSGFFQLDDGLFTQSAENRAVLGDARDGVGFRRTRLQALGSLTEDTRYSIEVDFAIFGRPSFLDVWGEQGDLPFFGTIRIGHFRQPSMMDGLTSIRHLDFLERSLPFQAMDPFRRTGIMAYQVADDEMSTLAYSAFATGFTFFNGVDSSYVTLGDTRFGTEIGDSGGISFAVRGTRLLYYSDKPQLECLHVGAGYIYGGIGGEGTSGAFAKTYESRPVPEFFVGDPTGLGLAAAGTPAVLDTGRIVARNFHFPHFELAGNRGPFHWQSEFAATFLNQFDGPTIFYYGAYAQCGWFLTGESAGYNRQTGVMDYNTPRPNSPFYGSGRHGQVCGWGAWELAFRWSYLNLAADNILPQNQLSNLAGPPPAPNPGEVNQSTVAVNWYWNQYTRVQFNWIHSMPDFNTGGFAPWDIYGTRFQIEF
jgi:phosphate-selective porin OprO/OprP